MTAKQEFGKWAARLHTDHERFRIAAEEAEQRQQDALNARYPESEGWQGAAERRGYRIRARQTEPAIDLGAYI